MKMVTWIFALTLLVTASSQAQQFSRTPSRVSRTPAPKASISDPAYRQLSTDEGLTVYEIKIAAGGKTLRNPHIHEYLLVAVGDADLEISGSGTAYKMHLRNGEMQVMIGRWAHSIASLGALPATLLEVDVAKGIDPEHAECGLRRAPCAQGRFGKDDNGTHLRNTLFQTPTVRLSRIELGPGGVMEQHVHRGEEALIALSDMDLNAGLAGGRPDELRSTAGSVHVYSAGTVHIIQNVGSQPARFLEFELR